MVCLDIPQGLHNLPQKTVGEMAAQFQEMLELCGIPQHGRDFLVNQGIMSATQFVKLSLDSGIKDLKKLAATVHIALQGGLTTRLPLLLPLLPPGTSIGTKGSISHIWHG